MSRNLRVALLALASVCLSLSACAPSAIVPAPPAASAPPTQLATVASPTVPSDAATATVPPDAAFRAELGAVTTLRGHLEGGEMQTLADVTIEYVSVQLPSPSLSDAQWDVFTIQRALWTGQYFTIPAGWEVSVVIYIPSTSPGDGTIGHEIGIANLHTASARHFNWDHLSPQQAWAQYDGVEYSATGI
ncbi:MAG: hypothetical protein ACHQ1E_08325 [Ktedonobacterales bacterium]